jgi:Tfp pilus assembly protein PilF
MSNTKWVIFLTSLTLTACAAVTSWNSDPYQDMVVGVKSFEEGDFATASMVFSHVLNHPPYDGLVTKDEKVTAHKYLAFIHCLNEEISLCHIEFRKALEIDPKFELKPEEIGHPKWGPVFREERARIGK